MTRALIGFLCALSVLSLPCLAQTQHYNFTYPDRTSFLAAGWDFLAVSSAVVTRNTEQTTGAVVTYDVAPGILQIPVDSGDLWSTQNDSRNTVFRSLPTDWTSMRLSLSFAPTTSYQQLGLVAYRDDDNYVNITRIFNGANQASFAVELAANPSVVNSATVTATTLLSAVGSRPDDEYDNGFLIAGRGDLGAGEFDGDGAERSAVGHLCERIAERLTKRQNHLGAGNNSFMGIECDPGVESDKRD